MTDIERYFRGFGMSVLVHGALAGIALWLWNRPPQKIEAKAVRWEIDMLSPAKPAPPPPSLEFAHQQIDDAAEPPEEVITQPLAPDAPASTEQTAPSLAPAFDIPQLALATGTGSIGTLAIPVPMAGLSGWPNGQATPGGGFGQRQLGAPAFDAGPTPTVRIPPVYPLEARRKKLEGWVRVEMTVLEDGSVTDVKVREANLPGVFEQAALSAIAQWKFRPATVNGKSVRRQAAQTLRFDLQD